LLNKLINQINKKLNENNNYSKKAVVGFDGFVDRIYRPVKDIKSSDKIYYKKIDDFGKRLSDAAGLSCDIDIELESIQPGGNTPLFANSLGHLGINTECISPIDEYERLFKDFMSENCNLISIGEPALSIVLEFFDGKVMLGDTHTFNDINWSQINNRVGDKIYNIFKRYDLISMVNWSHFNNMSEIWVNILNFLEKENFEFKEQTLFIDLADTNSRNKKDILEMLNLLKNFRNYYDVILGLNKNETLDIGNKLFNINNKKKIQKIGIELINKGYIDKVVIHPVAKAFLISKNTNFTVSVPKIENPTLTVGGGDNFNAGFCWGILNKLTPEQSLIMGAINSLLFVQNGYSPSVTDLYKYLSNYSNQINIHYMK
jgi:hypothetical protein